MSRALACYQMAADKGNQLGLFKWGDWDRQAPRRSRLVAASEFWGMFDALSHALSLNPSR